MIDLEASSSDEVEIIMETSPKKLVESSFARDNEVLEKKLNTLAGGRKK